MIIQGQPGLSSLTRQTAGNPNITQGYFAEMLSSQLDPLYYTLGKAGRLFCSTLTASATTTAFTGAAGGTPILGLYNPPSSGYDVIVIQTRLAWRTFGTGTTGVVVNWYGGPSANPTAAVNGTVRNMYSLQSTGSIVKNYSFTAMTGSTAIGLLSPIQSIGITPGTTATLAVMNALDLTQGTIVAAPGNLIAIGCPVALTAPVVDASIIWAELPV